MKSPSAPIGTGPSPSPSASAGTALDEAFERMASAGFELPNGFVNHGAMACEALDALGFDGELGEWAQRFARVAGPAVAARPDASFDWSQSLGNYRALPQWIGQFETAIAADGWAEVVQVWVPRLMPAMSTVLFHGVIRTAHAVRAIQGAGSEGSSPRREELARALGYWAARYRPGQKLAGRADVAVTDAVGTDLAVTDVAGVDDMQAAVVAAAAEAACYYLASPNIPFLHGVTGAMAVELLVPHLAGPDQADALAQLAAEHRSLYSGASPVGTVRVAGVARERLATSAEASGDPHEVKLVEAALRALDLSGDPAFAAACETVTGLSREGAA